MHPDGVRKSLLIDEDKAKEIVLSSGDRIRLRRRDSWLVAPEYLIVIDERGDQHHIDYRNIAEILPAKQNGRKRKKRA